VTPRPTFRAIRPNVVRVLVDSVEAREQIVRAYLDVWPEPDHATERLVQAIEAACFDDERTELSPSEADQVADALVRHGKPGTAVELRMAAQQAVRLDCLALRGFVGFSGRGELCYFADVSADGIPLEGSILEAAKAAPAWSVPRVELPRPG
jgi:hypothetical protein